MMFRPGAYASAPPTANPALSRGQIEDACLKRVADFLDETANLMEAEWPSWRRYRITGDQISGIPRALAQAIRSQIGS